MFKLMMMLFLTIFIVGCNNDSSKMDDFNISFNESNISMSEINQLLDNHEYEAVISKLDSVASNNDEYLALAEAYMGISGLDISKVISDICSSDKLMDFINKTDDATKECKTPLDYLNKAVDYYILVLGDSCESDDSNLTDFEKEICTYKGLAQTVESVTSINYLISYEKNAKKASACAMQYAFNGVEDGCSVFEDGELTFTQTNKTYERIDVVVNDDHFEYLLVKNDLTGVKEVVITDGYCSLDSFDTRVDSKNDPDYKESFHVCPVNLVNHDKTYITQSFTDADTYTTKQGIVDSFNYGTHSILIGDINNTLLKDKIIEFKDEIIESRDVDDGNETIKTEDIVSFFNKEN